MCFEQHQKALDIIEGRKIDPTFYPVIYGASDEDDWSSEDVWYKANPSLGYTIDIEKVQNAYISAKRECSRGECVPAAPSESVGETEHPVDADG